MMRTPSTGDPLVDLAQRVAKLERELRNVEGRLQRALRLIAELQEE